MGRPLAPRRPAGPAGAGHYELTPAFGSEPGGVAYQAEYGTVPTPGYAHDEEV